MLITVKLSLNKQNFLLGFTFNVTLVVTNKLLCNDKLSVNLLSLILCMKSRKIDVK